MLIPWPITSIPANSRRHRRDIARGIGMRQLARGLAHLLQAMRILQQRRDRFRQPDSFQLRLLHHHRGSVPRQSFGVDPLMIVGRARERNEHRRLPRRRNFRDRARSRAAHHQIGARKSCRHVFNELEDFRRLAQTSIRRQRVIIVTLAGLVNDVNSRRLALQNRQAANHRIVDGVRALASAEHQQGRSSAALGRRSRKMPAAPARP